MIDNTVIKSELGIMNADDDVLIDRKIRSAYHYVSKYSVFLTGADLTVFREFSKLMLDENDDGIILIKGNSGDIILKNITIDGVAVDLANVMQITPYRYKMSNVSGTYVTIEYDSIQLLNRIEDLIVRIVKYEVEKEKQKAYLRSTQRIEDIVTEQFVQDKQFYSQIDQELARCFAI